MDYFNGDNCNDKVLHKGCTSASGKEQASAGERRDRAERTEEQELLKMTSLSKET